MRVMWRSSAVPSKCAADFGLGHSFCGKLCRRESGRYSLNRLDERYGNAVLPEVITVDLCEENAAGNRTAISRRLAAELQKNLEAGEQSILLMNRRGYHTFVACRSCGTWLPAQIAAYRSPITGQMVADVPLLRLF